MGPYPITTQRAGDSAHVYLVVYYYERRRWAGWTLSVPRCLSRLDTLDMLHRQVDYCYAKAAREFNAIDKSIIRHMRQRT